MATGRPTKEAQDQYFREVGLDPWGYHRPFVQRRLDKSLRFVQRFVSADFDGAFVEIGAFNGDFTRRLTCAFPNAAIIASDIVKAPWEAAQLRAPFQGNVSFQWRDMLDFEMPGIAPSKTVLLLMECLYYLPAAQRSEAIISLADKTSANMAFVSGPIHGPDNYFSESFILEAFSERWPEFLGSKLLTPSGLMPWLSRRFRTLLRMRSTQRQVIYGFSRRAP